MQDLFNTPMSSTFSQVYEGKVNVHAKENNRESENNLNENRKHLEGKCAELLRRLMNGERLQFANEVHKIGDLRRRSLDLIEAGIPVQRTFIKGTRIKEYWLEQDYILKANCATAAVLRRV